MHGYELLGRLGSLFGPDYTPSPGGVYPALSALRAEGLVEVMKDAGVKRYRVSRDGTRALATRVEQLGAIERRTGVFLRESDVVEGELDRVIGLVRASEASVDPERVHEILTYARLRLESLVEGQGGEHDG